MTWMGYYARSTAVWQTKIAKNGTNIRKMKEASKSEVHSQKKSTPKTLKSENYMCDYVDVMHNLADKLASFRFDGIHTHIYDYFNCLCYCVDMTHFISY